MARPQPALSLPSDSQEAGTFIYLKEHDSWFWKIKEKHPPCLQVQLAHCVPKVTAGVTLTELGTW